MNIRNLVFGILGTLGVLFVTLVAHMVFASSETVEHQDVQRVQYEETRTRMRDVILVVGKDLREYRIQATYRLSSMAYKSDRRACETKITNLIMETASQTGGSKQIHTAIAKSLNTFADTTKHNDNCSVLEPFISVAQTVGD